MPEIINEIENNELVLTESSEEEKPTKKGLRWLQNGKYDKSPIDPEYYKKYYHRRYNIQCICEYCGKTLSNEQKISRHMLTARCQKKRMLNQSQ